MMTEMELKTRMQKLEEESRLYREHMSVATEELRKCRELLEALHKPVMVRPGLHTYLGYTVRKRGVYGMGHPGDYRGGQPSSGRARCSSSGAHVWFAQPNEHDEVGKLFTRLKDAAAWIEHQGCTPEAIDHRETNC